jgi:hypothetical protein
MRGFSPLDEELGLLPGALTPSLAESLTRLGTWMPFARAAGMLEHFTRTRISESTAKRMCLRAGAAYVEVQTQQEQSIRRELPQPPQGPSVQQLSVDGAMVPLVGGEWAEVKTLAIGTVSEPEFPGGKQQVHARDVSYFSRLADAETFTLAALCETHRRGVQTAGTVLGIADGAEWEQKFLDMRCWKAVRILDHGHAAEYVIKAAHVALGAGTSECAEWLETGLHELRHGEPDRVLDALRELWRRTGLEQVRVSLEYLEKRKEQIRYREFEALGYPIGSGMIESGNKLVVQYRLKGSGMHWARESVDPMCALRTMVCSDRWTEDWPLIAQQIRNAPRAQAQARRAKRAVVEEQVVEPQGAVAVPAKPRRIKPEPRQVAKTDGPTKPAANHPWRHSPIGRARYQPISLAPPAGM